MKESLKTNASASPAAKAPAEPLRVLVAEDDSDTRRTLVELLRSEGHLAEGAVSASDFWRVFHRLGPAVCLIDIGLPDRSGYEIAQEMGRRYGKDRPKLVAVTAWTKPSDRILAKIAGFDRHVAKPYDATALLALVSDIVTSSE